MVDVKELGYGGWTVEEIKNQQRIASNELTTLKKQLTQTQQALDIAKEALELTEVVSENVASYVCGHIQQMYPDAWKLIGESAKRSIKGSITNAWNFHINQVKPKKALKAIEGNK